MQDKILQNIHPDFARKVIKDFKLPFDYLNPDHFIKMIDSMSRVAPEFNDAVEILIHAAMRLHKEMQPTTCELIYKTTDAMVEHIKQSLGYNEFNNCAINTYFPVEQVNIPNGDIYTHENAGNVFIAIDMKNAAFQAMKLWDNLYGNEHGYLIGIDTCTYSEFVKDVMDHQEFEKTYHPEIIKTACEYVCKCKSLRQVIMGKTNPKRIMHIEKFIMQQVRSLTLDSLHIEPIRFNNDEVVYEYNENLEAALALPETLKSIEFLIGDHCIDIPIEFHKQMFNLEEYSLIQHTDLLVAQSKLIKFYKKDFSTFLTHLSAGIEFKSLPTTVYLVARALYAGHNGVARFLESQPIVVDGIVHYLALPGGYENTWELIFPKYKY